MSEPTRDQDKAGCSPVRYLRPVDSVFSVDMTYQEASLILEGLTQGPDRVLYRRFKRLVEHEELKREDG